MELAPFPEQPDWSNVEIIHRNILPPRAAFFNYTNVSDALSLDTKKARAVCLSGTWKFNVYENPFDVPKTRANKLISDSQYADIAVPGMWQLQGHGIGPRYTNMSLPFPVDPPHVPLFENETGHYIRTFEVPESFRGAQLRLRFEGVDSAFHLRVNEVDVGYSQGSRNPSEFDITDHVSLNGPNIIAVTVYQRSDGTYLEAQVSREFNFIYNNS